MIFINGAGGPDIITISLMALRVFSDVMDGGANADSSYQLSTGSHAFADDAKSKMNIS